MNRLVLIGNGFDLAHGLKTSYADFINWYWEYRMHKFTNTYSTESKDNLCSFKVKFGEDGHELWSTIAFSHNYFNSALGREYIGKDIIASIIDDKKNFETKFSPFFERIIKSIETKGWVDIENEYYRLLNNYAINNPSEENLRSLNIQLTYLQDLLLKYLTEISQQEVKEIPSIREAIYSPFTPNDIAISEKDALQKHANYWGDPSSDIVLNDKINLYTLETEEYLSELNTWRNKNNRIVSFPFIPACPKAFLLPNHIMFLNFNYTSTIGKYIKENSSIDNNHIHGHLSESHSIIFGYGDELDNRFKQLQELGNNECLRNVKSIRYLEAPNYRRMLSFIESEPYQVLIMGHSCGNSDRTLLNTIFEHKNCVSIKPYYYKKEDGTDNYIEIVQNISRNFTDMKLMRDRVVNKTQCEPLVHD